MYPDINSSKPHRYYLISYPRTASNLLLKILAVESQPGFSSGGYDGGYFFMPVDGILCERHLRSRCVSDWTSDERREVQESFQTCFENQLRWVESAQSQGHSIFVKEHTTFFADPIVRTRLQFGADAVNEPNWTVRYAGGSTHSTLNTSVLPDEFLLTWLPTFLIRHPAVAFPSYYRTIIEREGKELAAADNFASLVITVEWSRALYDFYLQHRDALPCSPAQRSEWPIVLDADDVINHPEIISLYCAKVGMDPQTLRFSWDQADPEKLAKMHPAQRAMRTTIYGSTGIVKGKSLQELNILDEASKWRSEFGDIAAQHIEKLVRQAMPDYEYLRARRLRATPA
ncbi:hypothetical protein PFICI_13585 [Pestalotiopsis fici W106-1]|uniref:Sulfotransferase domain-containing protein n=1 Tax=Pestalotiopsis fici (strain W106-1 / CGMCC3.15140) TaxID=1229662 RepID=W3WQJ0_PESFW|nr:uncharacterized protein PFICI_13585 [Pestalotiopsis fici W106-1]ETS75101.1 hypothetical protein PFICI_13585 [Pestalotiopsis fici W106-1]